MGKPDLLSFRIIYMVVIKELYLKHHFFKLLESNDVLNISLFSPHHQPCHLPLKKAKMTPQTSSNTPTNTVVTIAPPFFEREGKLKS